MSKADWLRLILLLPIGLFALMIWIMVTLSIYSSFYMVLIGKGEEILLETNDIILYIVYFIWTMLIVKYSE